MTLDESPDQGPDGPGSAEAKGISRCGSITGYTSIDSKNRAWLLRKNKQTWIGPSDENTIRWSVNCSDEVVGWWERPFQGMRAFFWSTETGILDLGLNQSLGKVNQ